MTIRSRFPFRVSPRWYVLAVAVLALLLAALLETARTRRRWHAYRGLAAWSQSRAREYLKIAQALRADADQLEIDIRNAAPPAIAFHESPRQARARARRKIAQWRAQADDYARKAGEASRNKAAFDRRWW